MIPRYSRAAAAALDTFIDGSTVPEPKFAMFDVAVMHFESEEGESGDELVQIVGFRWHPSGTFVTAWWYHVRCLEKPTGINSHLPAGYQEDCLEDELTPLVDVIH